MAVWVVVPGVVTAGAEPLAAGMPIGDGARRFRVHEVSAPPLLVRSSDTVSVHTPFGSSPTNAPKASSAASVALTVPPVYVV